MQDTFRPTNMTHPAWWHNCHLGLRQLFLGAAVICHAVVCCQSSCRCDRNLTLGVPVGSLQKLLKCAGATPPPPPALGDTYPNATCVGTDRHAPLMQQQATSWHAEDSTCSSGTSRVHRLCNTPIGESVSLEHSVSARLQHSRCYNRTQQSLLTKACKGSITCWQC